MKRFTTDHLTTFAAVIEHGTFDAAAESLRVSPSAISQRIKVMEQLAGKVLLRRTNPVTPTQAGQSVLRIARQSAFLQQEMDASSWVPVASRASPLPSTLTHSPPGSSTQ